MIESTKNGGKIRLSARSTGSGVTLGQQPTGRQAKNGPRACARASGQPSNGVNRGPVLPALLAGERRAHMRAPCCNRADCLPPARRVDVTFRGGPIPAGVPAGHGPARRPSAKHAVVFLAVDEQRSLTVRSAEPIAFSLLNVEPAGSLHPSLWEKAMKIERRNFLHLAGGAAAFPAFSNIATAQTSPDTSPMSWGRMTRAERNAAYNSGAAVKETAQIIDGWVSASKAFRSQRSQHIDLVYGPGERNKWDLFPGNNPKAPCLVHVHGGFWQSRNREDFSCLAEGALARGWSVALPGYTLAPAATLTQIVAEVRSSLDWLTTSGSAHGISVPIILSGWSSGGHLTALLLDHPNVVAGLAISGFYELGPVRDTFINERLKLTDQEVAALSPIRLAGVSKPLAITYGTAELPALVRNAREYHAQRARHHFPGPLIPIPNANHFTGLESLRQPDGILTRTAARLIEDAG